MRERRAALLACALPPVLLTVILAAGLLATPFGYDALWPTPELTLAEAAALRDAAGVRLAIERGSNLRAPVSVRAGIFGAAMTLSPLDAAAIAGYGEMVALMLDQGHLTIDADEALRLACLAYRYDRHEVRAVLAERFPATAEIACPQVRRERR